MIVIKMINYHYKMSFLLVLVGVYKTSISKMIVQTPITPFIFEFHSPILPNAFVSVVLKFSTESTQSVTISPGHSVCVPMHF